MPAGSKNKVSEKKRKKQSGAKGPFHAAKLTVYQCTQDLGGGLS